MPNGARPNGPRQGRCVPAVGRRWVDGASASPIVPALVVGATQLSTDGRASIRNFVDFFILKRLRSIDLLFCDVAMQEHTPYLRPVLNYARLHCAGIPKCNHKFVQLWHFRERTANFGGRL